MPQIAQVHYADVMDRIRELVELGTDVVDIMLIVGEEYPRDVSQEALVEARTLGLL